MNSTSILMLNVLWVRCTVDMQMTRSCNDIQAGKKPVQYITFNDQFTKKAQMIEFSIDRFIEFLPTQELTNWIQAWCPGSKLKESRCPVQATAKKVWDWKKYRWMPGLSFPSFPQFINFIWTVSPFASSSAQSTPFTSPSGKLDLLSEGWRIKKHQKCKSRDKVESD